MTTYEAISLMIMYSMFVVTLISLIITIVKVILTEKK
jgi:hypothetical protein